MKFLTVTLKVGVLYENFLFCLLIFFLVEYISVSSEPVVLSKDIDGTCVYDIEIDLGKAGAQLQLLNADEEG